MSKMSKIDKARKLVKLTGAGIGTRQFDSSKPKEHVDLRKKLEEDAGELQAQLREKHYSDEQLDALLAFYESDIGKSILEANKLIRSEFTAKYREIAQAVAIKIDGDRG